MVDPMKPPKAFKEQQLNKSKGILDDFAVRKVVATRQGTITHTPTEEIDLVNKKYVDAQIRGAVDLFLTENGSDIGTYFDLETDVVTAAKEDITQAITANSTTLIASFASILDNTTIDAITLLEEGVYTFHAHASTNFAIGMTMYFEFYHRTAGGTETLLGTSHDSGTLTTSEAEYNMHATITTDTAFVAGDRIVLKVYGRNGGAASKNITIYMEGDTASRVEFPGFIAPSGGGAYSRSATLVVAASDSLDTTNADYFCDGTADEVQINEAIDALPATGGSILLMDGTYDIDASITIDVSNTSIIGQGKSTKILTDDNITMITGANLEGILITNIYLEGPYSGTGIFLSPNIDHSMIRNCWFKTIYTGIFLQTGNFCSVIGCNFDDNNTGVYTNNIYYCNIVGCLFDNLTVGVQINGYPTTTVSACTFYSCTRGAYIRANGTTVVGCSGRNNNRGVEITQDKCSVVGYVSYADTIGIMLEGAEQCSVVGNSGHDTSSYFIDCSNGRGNTITGNSGEDLRGSAGIRLRNANYNTVSNNAMTKLDREGILVTGGDHNIISGNNIHDCSEDANDTYSGILLTGTATYNVVSNNRVSADAGNKHQYGIREAAAADDYNLIHGNILTDAVTANLSSQGANSVTADNIAP